MTHRPKAWRVLLAFSVAPGLASLALAWAQPLYAGLPDLWSRVARSTFLYAFFGAYPLTILFGLPLYFTIRGRLKPTLLNCSWAGTVTAAAPCLLLGLLFNPDYAFSNGHVTHEHGMKTLWGLAGPAFLPDLDEPHWDADRRGVLAHSGLRQTASGTGARA